jgi:hypothetical protein
MKTQKLKVSLNEIKRMKELAGIVVLNESVNEVKQIIKEEQQINELFGIGKKQESPDYIIIPQWQGKRNVKLTLKHKPYVSSDYVQFYVGENGIDNVIFYNKTVGDTKAKITFGNNATVINLDRSEADRLRNKYFK